jgi:hypothetical protein
MLLRKVMVLPLLAATPFAGITLTRFCGYDLRLRLVQKINFYLPQRHKEG